MGKMIKEFKIKNKNVQVFYESPQPRNLPVIILNTFGYDGKTVYNKCKELKCKEFILIAISGLEWNNEMTPWKAPNITKKAPDFTGKADYYLQELENDIIPKIEKTIKENYTISYYALAGYSLGGLFALYSAYKSTKFTKTASISGSLWYPNLLEYIKRENLKPQIKKIYFSLGTKEKESKNKLLQTVEQNTKEIENILSTKTNTIYEENEGTHFQNPELRTAKGIKWLLEEKKN